MITLLLLILMEVSLSFDNAVLNASILRNMSPAWQKRFITWGMPIAVLGMRLLFPILIVAAATGLSVIEIGRLAIYNPGEYARHLSNSHVAISAFGGMFLLMVFLNFILDSRKEVHWLSWIEKHLVKLGELKAVEICFVLTAIITLSLFVTPTDRSTFQISATLGLLVYMLVDALSEFFGELPAKGLAAFLYLEILDASCSFDGVIGAFVLTNNIILIMIGLGIGALIIRSLTIYLVKGGILQEYIYLEHGAHYGIGALAIIMLADIFYSVPEPITGAAGISFIGLSLLSSWRAKRK